MPSFDLICLANSYKHQRRCVAGLRADGGGWIRPVSGREQGELDYHQYCYPDRSEPRLLDVFRVGLSEPCPLPHHPENWLIDGSAWEPVQRPGSAECYARIVAAAISHDPLLFGSPGNRVPEEHFQKQAARESLVLVRPGGVDWYREPEGESGRNPARVRFHLRQCGYDLPLTDPVRRRFLTMEPPGSHSAEDLYIPPDRKLLLAISLSEPFSGFCYKLVAGVVVVPQAWNSLF